MKRAFAAALVAASLAAHISAQEPLAIAPERPTGKFFLRSYEPPTAPPLRPARTARLHGLIRAGNLYLTAADAIALAIENSLDLEVERYNLALADWTLERAQSGGPVRGVPSSSTTVGFVAGGQGVTGNQQSSSGVGSGTGAAAQTGAASIQSIGVVAPQFDPTFQASFAASHTSQPQIQLVLAGTNELVDSQRGYYGSFTQGLLSGGTASLTYRGSYLQESAPTDVLNPTSAEQLGFTFTQPLLRGFGARVNSRAIRVAERGPADSRAVFRNRLTMAVSAVLNLYWDFAVATEDLNYKEKNREIARQFLADTKTLIAAGAVPAIDIVRVEATLAGDEQAWRVAVTTLDARENALKDAISWHGGQDAELSAAHVITVDPLEVPPADNLPPVRELVAAALKQRPDLALARSRVEEAQINAIGTIGGLLPSLAVQVATTDVGQTGQPVPGAGAGDYFIGGAGASLGQVFRRNFPNETFATGFSVNPKNSGAQADYALDQLSTRQLQINMQRTENQLAVDISNQVMALKQARASYEAFVESRELQQKLLEGEEKKLKAGTSLIATVVEARRALDAAQSSELAAAEAYVRNRIALDQGIGVTLEANHVSVDDAIQTSGR